MFTVVLGMFIATGVLAYALVGGSGGNSYIDLPSLILVFGGAISASFMSVTLDNLRELFSCLKMTFFQSAADDRRIKEELMIISRKASLAKHVGQINHISESPFINKSLRLLQSEVGDINIYKILGEAIQTEKSMATRCSDMIKSMAKYPPAFGMIGTILGLIGLMQEISLSSGMEKIGVKMGLALITTLYGLLISNYFLNPLSDIVLNKAQTELKIKKLILDTFVMIAANRHDPVLVSEFLGMSSATSHDNYINSEAA